MFEYESKGFLDALSGETQDADWKRLADEIGGEFVSGERDGWGSASKVVYRVGRWTIMLEAFKYGSSAHPGNYVMHTRITAHYITNDFFHFWISPPDFLDDLKNFFGFENKKDIKIGDEELDRKYVFFGSDDSKLKQLFEDTNLRRMLKWFGGDISYGVKGADQWLSKTHCKKSFHLYFDHPGLIYDTVKLRVIMELFAETLNQLEQIDSIE